MSEKETIDIINRFLVECENDIDGEITLKCGGLTKRAIQNLFELYKEEKEQNSLIKEKLKELNIPMETLIGEFNRLEDLEDDREQLKWRLKEGKENYDKLTKHFIENHISKDKIRAKIEELLKEGELMTEEQRQKETEYMQGKLRAYEELLEEN